MSRRNVPYVDEAELQQVQREHRDFLIFTAIGRELSAFAVKDEIISALFPFSTTFKPSLISRRNSNECR
jgi:hypothetical protein